MGGQRGGKKPTGHVSAALSPWIPSGIATRQSAMVIP